MAIARSSDLDDLGIATPPRKMCQAFIHRVGYEASASGSWPDPDANRALSEDVRAALSGGAPPKGKVSEMRRADVPDSRRAAGIGHPQRSEKWQENAIGFGEPKGAGGRRLRKPARECPGGRGGSGGRRAADRVGRCGSAPGTARRV
ncbi:hypothetical protein GCM10027440_06050 [Nocardiopsis coralliicola]